MLNIKQKQYLKWKGSVFKINFLQSKHVRHPYHTRISTTMFYQVYILLGKAAYIINYRNRIQHDLLMIFLLTNNTFSLVLKWSLRVFVVAQSITVQLHIVGCWRNFISLLYVFFQCFMYVRYKVKDKIPFVMSSKYFRQYNKRGGSTAIWSSLHQNMFCFVLMYIVQYKKILEKSYSSTDAKALMKWE